MINSLTQLPLLDNSDFYYPLYLAKKYSTPIAYRIKDKVLYASLMDWFTVLTGERDKAAETWTNISRVFSKQGTEYDHLLYKDDYIGADGKTYQAIYAHELFLYAVAQEMRSIKSRPQVQEVKEYLRTAGFALGEMFRNPDKAAETFRLMAAGRKEEFEALPADDLKKYRRLIASGYDMREADQWMQFDKLGNEAYKKVSKEWYNRDGDIPKLANRTTEIVTGFSATDLKRHWSITDSPRQYLSTVEKAALGWIESVAATIHQVNDSHGTSQLLDDINGVGNAIDMKKLNQLTDVRVKRPLPKPKQPKLLKDTNDEN